MLSRVSVLALIAVMLVLAYSLAQSAGRQGSSSVEKKETAFERVMRTRTLRCGYMFIAPTLIKDNVTGQLSGPSYDLANKIGDLLGLKVEWTEETSFAMEAEGLKTGRYDMACFLHYMRPNLMTSVEFIQPFFFAPILVVQRTGETRFRSVGDIDKDGIRIGGVDGTIPSLIAQDSFKNAKVLSMPEMTPYSENMMVVMTRKADVTFVDPTIFSSFQAHNPGKLEINKAIPPLRMFAVNFAVGKGEHDLQSMVDAAVKYLLLNRQVERVLGQYESMRFAVPVAPFYATMD